jgi:hypothetical protein
MEYLLGFAVASLVSVLATLVGFDKERGFYAVVLIVIASYYVLFAVMGASASTLATELLALAVFAFVAIIGFKRSPWIVVAGLAGHAVFDFLHPHFVVNAGVPDWWPGFCLAYDLTAASYLAWLLKNRGANHAA